MKDKTENQGDCPAGDAKSPTGMNEFAPQRY